MWRTDLYCQYKRAWSTERLEKSLSAMAQNCWEELRTAVVVVADINRVVKAATPIRRRDLAAM